MGTKKPETATPEAKVEEITKGLVPLEKEAKSIVIKSEEDVTNAVSFLSKVKSYMKRVTELQDFFTDPYVEQRRVALEHANRIKALFAPKLTPLEDMERVVKRAIGDYRLEEERKARVEEERKQKVRDAANAKREEEGKGQILTPVATVERAAPTVKTDEGRATTRKVWKFEVLDETKLLSDKMFAHGLITMAKAEGLHEKLLRSLIKTGTREVAGVRIYEDIEVSVSAN